MRKFWAWIDHQSQHEKSTLKLIGYLVSHRITHSRRHRPMPHHYQRHILTKSQRNLMDIWNFNQRTSSVPGKIFIVEFDVFNVLTCVGSYQTWWKNNIITWNGEKIFKFWKLCYAVEGFTHSSIGIHFIHFSTRSQISTRFRFIFLCKWLFNFSNNFFHIPLNFSHFVEDCVNTEFHQFHVESPTSAHTLPTRTKPSSCYRKMDEWWARKIVS